MSRLLLVCAMVAFLLTARAFAEDAATPVAAILVGQETSTTTTTVTTTTTTT